MKITKYIHSCVLAEEWDSRILFDPGDFVFRERKVSPRDFTNISAIVVTHEHADHISVPALKTILTHNPKAVVIGSERIRDILHDEDISVSTAQQEYQVGKITLKTHPAAHGHLLYPPPQNMAYTINDIFLHPGDSVDAALHALAGSVKVLALPIIAPWADQVAIGAFAAGLRPETIIPIHDGFAKDFFLLRQYKTYETYFAERGISFRPLAAPGGNIEIKTQHIRKNMLH